MKKALYVSILSVLLFSSCDNLLLIEASQLHKVTFESNGGSTLESYRTKRIEKSPSVTKDDATFSGWFESSDFSGEKISFPYEVQKDTVLYAKWLQRYAVHFVSNGGREIPGYKSDVIESAPDITRDGYYFAGWYETSDFGGEAVQFPYHLTANKTLYAKWIKISHVRFETNGGSEVPEMDTAIINASPESSKTGYVLLGWYKEAELQNQISFPYVLAGDSVFYAKWTEVTDTLYKVEHYRQNANLDSELESYEFFESENLAGKTNALTQAVAKTYEGFSCFTFSQSRIAADASTVIKIYYYRKKYTVSFNPNGGAGEAFSQDFYYGCPQTLAKNTFLYTGHIFAGWSSSALGKEEYSDRATYEASGDITLYALWKESETVTYTVQHYKQTSSLGNNYELVSGDTQTLSGKTGEFTKAAAKSYTGFTEKAFSQIMIDGTETPVVKIYYDRNKYTLSFIANGGRGTMASQTFYYGIEDAIRENAFEKPGYSFGGWAESSDGLVMYGNKEKVSLTGNLVLYANWYYEISVEASNVENLNLSSLAEACTLNVSGRIDQSKLVTLAKKIANSNVEITLDLSETQGLVTIGPAGSNTSIFKDCRKLVTVVFPSSLTIIGAYAFYNCNGLRSISIGKNVKTIGAYAFSSCSNLESVEIEGTDIVGERAFYICTNIRNLYLKNINTIGHYAFSNCSCLTAVTIDAVSVAGNAFGSCTSLTAVSIGERVKELLNSSSSSVFYGCSVLTSVIFENTSGWNTKKSETSYSPINVSNASNNASQLKSSSVTWCRR